MNPIDLYQSWHDVADGAAGFAKIKILNEKMLAFLKFKVEIHANHWEEGAKVRLCDSFVG